MTDSGIDLVPSGPPPRRAGSRRAERTPRKRPRWGRVLVVLLVVAALAVAGKLGYDTVQDAFGGPEDYTGAGTGEVVVDIPDGATGGQIAQVLYEAGVVKSAEAFYDLALSDSRASAIEAGSYALRERMSAAAALDALTDRGNRVEGKVTVPEGARVGQIVTRIAEATEIPEADLTAALDDPVALGLPEIAGGNPEGYLYPATYTVRPGATASEVLGQMVAKSLEVMTSLDIEARAQALGRTTEEILTIASILEAEAKLDEDYPKVARVIYNRLAIDMPLQMDSTVSYVSRREGDVWTTPEERANPSEYNTYQNTGLPPGPIGSPGEKTIEAALNPADGDWLYFVSVDLATGRTKFASTLAEHEKNAEEARAYCRESDVC